MSMNITSGRIANGPVVIIGAGMAGLLAALLIKKRRPNADVTVVEASEVAGGTFRGVELDGFGYCDRAMRLLYETGIPEVDALLHGLLPRNSWHVLPDNVKDVAGVYWRGELQTHTPYLDLRRLPEDIRQSCEREILARIRASGQCGNDPSKNGGQNAAIYLDSRFGPTAAQYLTSVLEKFYLVPASALDASATHQPTMDRVVLYGEEQMQPVLADAKMRAVIAWPDQATLPVKRRPPQSGLYPRRFGMNAVIDAAVQEARELGVRFLFRRRVASLKIAGHAISMLNLDGGEVLENPALVIGANGLGASLSLLRDPREPALRGVSPPKSWMVFLRSAQPPSMRGLYHFWCFDEAYSTFRVTNYANYCPAARTASGYPLCVELWSPDDTAAESIARALRELRAMGILNGDNLITAQAALPERNTHALCTTEAVQCLRMMRDELRKRSPENMITVGPFTEKGVMLLYEVCRSMHSRIVERLN